MERPAGLSTLEAFAAPVAPSKIWKAIASQNTPPLRAADSHATAPRHPEIDSSRTVAICYKLSPTLCGVAIPLLSLFRGICVYIRHPTLSALAAPVRLPFFTLLDQRIVQICVVAAV